MIGSLTIGSAEETRRQRLRGRNVHSRHLPIRREPMQLELVEVLDLIMKEGIVIDAYVRTSGFDLTMRAVIASADTYQRYAEGAMRFGSYDD